MKVTGSATLHAPREAVWTALNDPAVLARTIPGCEQLEEAGPDAYRMTLSAGVASIKGTYIGEVALTDPSPPQAFTLRASGAGAPGTVQAAVRVTLHEESNDLTRLEYDADAVVGGMIGGVGQRVLSGVAKKTAGEFFRAVDDVLTGRLPVAAADLLSAPVSPTATGSAGPHAPPTTYNSSPPASLGDKSFVRGMAVGASLALAGALVGGFVARRAG